MGSLQIITLLILLKIVETPLEETKALQGFAPEIGLRLVIEGTIAKSEVENQGPILPSWQKLLLE